MNTFDRDFSAKNPGSPKVFCQSVPLSRGLSRACDPNCSSLNTSSVRLENPEFCRRVSVEDFRKIDGCCCIMVSEQSMEEFLEMLLHGMGAEPRPFQNVQSI